MKNMLLWGILLGMMAATAAYTYARVSRLGLYRSLASRESSLERSAAVGLAADAAGKLPDFHDRLVTLPACLAPEDFERVKTAIVSLVGRERSYLPAHKKGGTVAYETLIEQAPEAVELYRSAEMRGLVSRIVGHPLVPTPLHDQSSCSVLFYEKPGDHIGWHYDHNFYRGRHFTVLLPIVNEGPAGLSSARLIAKVAGEERSISTPPNSLVLFEGARVLHKVTPITDGERRVVLSMTYTTDPSNSVLQGVVRRIKDVAFFGIRALWT
jgi:hypothetical protein